MIRQYLKRAAAAAMIVALSAAAGLALNVDQTRTPVKRYLGIDAVHYYRVTINYNDANISTAQKFGALGANAFINRIECHVTTTFNAVSSNAVTFGTSTSANEIVAASGANASITLSSATYQDLSAAAGLGVQVTSGGDVTLYAKYTQTGTAATQGSVTCVIEFIPNNDM